MGFRLPPQPHAPGPGSSGFGVCIALFAAALAGGCTAADSGSSPLDVDAIYHNGTILTVNENFDAVGAVAVSGGRIARVGSENDILALRGPATELVDLKGATMLPGFNDCHVHLGTGDPPEVHDWTSLEDLNELSRVLDKAADSLPAGTWIQGKLRNEHFPEQRIPDRYDLDEVVSDHPVVLTRGAHVMILNSLGLKAAGISGNTQPAPGGTVVFDESGEPTGILREKAAWRLALEDIPRSRPPAAEAREALLGTLSKLPPLGVTSINVAGMRPNALRHLQSLYKESGNELVRSTVQLRVYPGYDAFDDLDRAVQATNRELDALGVHTGFGDRRFKLGGVKMSIDGGFTGQAFWSLEPYPERPGFNGLVRVPEKSFRPVAAHAHRLGWQLGIHAIGDAAVAMVVRSLDDLLDENPRSDHRHFLHHVSVKPPEEILDQMAELKIAVCSQPNFAYALSDYATAALEGERLRTNNPQASLTRHGIRVAYGSDGMPLGPLVGIFAAVTREGSDGEVYGADERMDVGDAIRAYTSGSAWLSFDEEEKGSIEEGKLADFVVLSRNPLSIPPDSLQEIDVLMTVIGGRVVYRSTG